MQTEAPEYSAFSVDTTARLASPFIIRSGASDRSCLLD